MHDSKGPFSHLARKAKTRENRVLGTAMIIAESKNATSCLLVSNHVRNLILIKI